jgi:signal recognition particle receptor subunit beta
MSGGGLGQVVNARIVYWGVSGGGKTANLEYIHGKLRPDHRGDLQRVATPEDPGVHYEVMAIELGEISKVRTRLQILALPGGVDHAATRKQLLDQVDGVVFVIDSRRDRLSENLAALDELRRVLGEYGRLLEEVPVVLQYNHRDQTDDLAVEELHRKIGLRAAAFEAIAPRGVGVLESLTTISKRVVRNRREAAGLTVPPATATQPPGPAPIQRPGADGRFGPDSRLPAADRDSTIPGEEKTQPAEEKTQPAEEKTQPEERALPEEPAPSAPDPSATPSVDAAARRAERVFDEHWDGATGGFEARTAPGEALDLRLVSAEAPVVESERQLRLALRVVDQEGREGELVLTLDLGHLPRP